MFICTTAQFCTNLMQYQYDVLSYATSINSYIFFLLYMVNFHCANGGATHPACMLELQKYLELEIM